MSVAEPEIEKKPDEMKPEETKPTVQELLEKATPEVRSALEAMRRSTRSKKTLTQPARLPQIKYFRFP